MSYTNFSTTEENLQLSRLTVLMPANLEVEEALLKKYHNDANFVVTRANTVSSFGDCQIVGYKFSNEQHLFALEVRLNPEQHPNSFESVLEDYYTAGIVDVRSDDSNLIEKKVRIFFKVSVGIDDEVDALAEHVSGMPKRTSKSGTETMYFNLQDSEKKFTVGYRGFSRFGVNEGEKIAAFEILSRMDLASNEIKGRFCNSLTSEVKFDLNDKIAAVRSGSAKSFLDPSESTGREDAYHHTAPAVVDQVASTVQTRTRKRL